MARKPPPRYAGAIYRAMNGCDRCEGIFKKNFDHSGHEVVSREKELTSYLSTKNP